MAVRTNRLVRSAAAVTLVGAGVAAGITGSVSTAVAQTPTPVLTVVSSSSYGPEPDGFLYIVGEVQNTGTDDVQDGTVQVGLYNVGGTQLAIDTRTIEVSELAPGEKGGFVDIVPPPSGYDHFKILGATGIDDGTPPYRQFSVTGVTDVANSGGLHQVNATVTNTGYYTAQNVKADMTFYNAAGIVVDVDTFPLNGGASLAPAATTALAENDIPAHIQYTRFAVLIEGTTTTPACGPCVPFTRIGGTTRIGTAVLTSQDTFPTAGTAKAVVLARADTFPDALAGGPLAAHVGGPLLLTEPTGLDPATQAEIVRVAPAGSTVYILGGPSAVASSVDPILTGLGYKVQRVFGADRYATAVAVAGVLGNPATVFEATGINFPDALSGGPAAVANTAAILLTDGAVQAPATAAYLVAHASMRYALGGPAAAADPAATAIVGADRYGTSAAIATTFFGSAKSLGIATALNFPDALAAGPDLGTKGAPLLLVPPSSPLNGAYAPYVYADGPNVTTGEVFGGTSAVGDDIVLELQQVLGVAGAL
jgi:hypothetical protein